MIGPTSIVIATLLAATHPPAAVAFQASPHVAVLHRRRPHSTATPPRPRASARSSPAPSAPSAVVLRGIFGDDDLDDDAIPIPPELRDDIYRAEAKTPAAEGRQLRVGAYITLTLLGATVGFFNAFLTDLRFGDGSPSPDLMYYGFGWVRDNFLLNFLFTTTPGGLIGLLGAGLSGTLAEVELRSKDENAEKIWAEMQLRKARKETPKKMSRKKKRAQQQRIAPSSKKDMTGKQRKRLLAIEELMVEDAAPVVTEDMAPTPTDAEVAASEPKEDVAEAAGREEDGILGKIKGFYKQADSMAASQALLLNKELEERGIVEKITDESGLRVVGKEAASAAAEKKALLLDEE